MQGCVATGSGRGRGGVGGVGLHSGRDAVFDNYVGTDGDWGNWNSGLDPDGCAPRQKSMLKEWCEEALIVFLDEYPNAEPEDIFSRLTWLNEHYHIDPPESPIALAEVITVLRQVVNAHIL